MGKLPEPASEFLRPEDVNDGDTLEVTGHPETIPAEETKFGKERHIAPVKLPNGQNKRWGLNLTSYRTLYKAFGSEGDDWIGKHVNVTKNREKVRGETVYVLYAEPTKQQPQQQPLTVPNEIMQIVDQEALAKLPRSQQEKLLRKLSMQTPPTE